MIWLTGRNGMLGREVETVLESRGADFAATGREVDITSPEAVQRFADGRDIEWIVNCAAYTAVDRAESEEEAAFALNAVGPGNLARLCRERGAKLIHLSTDYVFDGSKPAAYDEEDELRPMGAYGRSKAEGERRIADGCDEYVILRTSWLFGIHGKNFVSTILRLLAERDEIAVVDDQIGRPTAAPDLAGAIATVMDAGGGNPDAPGTICHYACSGTTSWYGFAQEIRSSALRLGLLERCGRIRPIPTAEYPTPTRRPANSVLSTERFERTFGTAPRPWRDALGEYLESIAASRRKGART